MKKKREGVDLSNVIPVNGHWLAVLEDEDVLEVAAWAVTDSGMIGLVAAPGERSLGLAPVDCVGYVRRSEGETVLSAIERLHDALDDGEVEEDIPDDQ